MTVTTTRLPLATGAQIPQIGLGVWQSPRGAPTRDAVTAALELGYRHVDTARIYQNEADVGAAVNAGPVPRADVFVTTKLWNDDQGYDSALRALEKAFADGKAKAIGVSNYLVPHLREVLDHAKVKPHVDQIELTPFLQRRDTRALCAEHGIVVEAYSPLTRGQRLDDPVIGAIAKAVERTPAQVILRWGIEHGHVILPKSVTRSRIEENAALFDFTLDAAQLAKLDALDEGLATGWDPDGAP